MYNIILKDRIKKLLSCYPHLRDDDRALICNVWYQEISGLTLHGIKDFLRWYAEGNGSNSDSITRLARQVKEEHPELAGTRQRKTEKEVQKDLGYNIK